MRRLWAIGVYDLGLTSEEFWALTPIQFDALLDRRDQEKQENEFLPAQIIASIINYSMVRPEKPADARDYMLHFRAANPTSARQRSSSDRPKKMRITAKRRKQVCDFFRAWAPLKKE